MQTEQINDVCWLKYTILFHVIEKSVKKMTNANKEYISLELLNTLIMYREPSDYAFPCSPLPCVSVQMLQHLHFHPLCVIIPLKATHFFLLLL